MPVMLSLQSSFLRTSVGVDHAYNPTYLHPVTIVQYMIVNQSISVPGNMFISLEKQVVNQSIYISSSKQQDPPPKPTQIHP